MKQPFGPSLKLQTAAERVHAVARDVAEYSRDLKGEMRIIDKGGGDRSLRIVAVKDAPDSLYVHVAECVYHLRSALDQTIVAIASANGGNGKNNYFPFAGDAAEYAGKGTRNKLADVPADAVRLIDGLRPYSDGDGALWALSRLSNIDRHNGLVPFGNAGSLAAMHVGHMHLRNARGGIRIGSPPTNLYEGIELIDLGPHGEVDINGLLTIELRSTVVFGPDVDVFAGQPVVDTLCMLGELTAGIVEALRAFSLRT